MALMWIRTICPRTAGDMITSIAAQGVITRINSMFSPAVQMASPRRLTTLGIGLHQPGRDPLNNVTRMPLSGSEKKGSKKGSGPSIAASPFLKARLAEVLAQPYAVQHLAINPVSEAAKPPQKMTVSAGKTTFPPNYFCNRILTLPAPITTSPLFYRVFVGVSALIFAMKIVPTVGMTNLETML